MRLLQLQDDGGVKFAEIYGDIPAYAILSHTWGADVDEVIYQDMIAGNATEKAGYQKIRFCVEKAANDDLRYFWIDTCCIDKSSSAELSEAINSMFRWYKNAAKCYVYLADVSIREWTREYDSDLGDLRTLILQQRFYRGWTLQELLAPAIVEFFTLEGEKLGDKKSLIQQLQKVTQIALGALEGESLSKFSVDERMAWTTKRKTKREEDAAYCLFGLFDLHMPLLYGEGTKRAFIRLLREIQHDQEADMPPGLEQALSGSLTSHRDIGTSKKSPVTSYDNIRAAPGGENVALADASADVASTRRPMEIDQQRVTEMQTWWNDSISQNMRPDGYGNVAVLLIKWADELDELRTSAEVEELEAVFRERYNFRTEIVELNITTKPQLQLTHHLSTFVMQYDSPDTLLIVYYSGHGIFHEDNGYLELAASLRYVGTGFSQSPRANWTKAEKILQSEEIESDILAILDTTYASNVMKSGETVSNRKHSQFELLSACGIDQTTAAPGQNSFTRALIDTLIELLVESEDRSFSTFQLNQRISLDKRRHDTPSVLWSLARSSERHIRLSRLKRDEKDAKSINRSLRPWAQGHLTLRLALRDKWLDRQQIELMARSLTKTFSDKPVFGVRSIDWVDYNTTETCSFGTIALTVLVILQWKKLVLRTRQERDITMQDKEHTHSTEAQSR